MRPHDAGDDANAAQDNESKENVLHSELTDPFADGGRLPKAGEVNADGKKEAEDWAELPSIRRLSGNIGWGGVRLLMVLRINA